MSNIEAASGHQQAPEGRFRTLLRVTNVDTKSPHERVAVVVPGWEPYRKVIVHTDTIPEELRPELQIGARFEVNVTLGTKRRGELRPSEFEFVPSSDSNNAEQETEKEPSLLSPELIDYLDSTRGIKQVLISIKDQHKPELHDGMSREEHYKAHVAAADLNRAALLQDLVDEQEKGSDFTFNPLGAFNYILFTGSSEQVRKLTTRKDISSISPDEPQPID